MYWKTLLNILNVTFILFNYTVNYSFLRTHEICCYHGNGKMNKTQHSLILCVMGFCYKCVIFFMKQVF